MIRSAAPAVRLKEGSASPSVGLALFLLMKPNVVAAVALSGYAGLVLSLGRVPDCATGGLCLASLALAAAGSALINNLLDRRMDLRMDRVRYRGCALNTAGSGVVVGVAVAQIAGALALAARLNGETVFFLVVAVFSYTVIYTLFLKRCSPWGAVLGAIPGALPVLVGQAASGGALTWAPLLLFLAILLWQPPHFWALALCYAEEYRRAGVPVLPLVKGESFTRRGICLGTVATVAVFPLLHLVGPCSALYAELSLLLGAAFCAATFILVRGKRYRLAFGASIVYLVAVLTTLIVDLTVRVP